MGTLEISPDGKSIKYLDHNGQQRWTNNTPTVQEWVAVYSSSQSEESLRIGVFRWLNGLNDQEATVVFCPYKGLDFNLIYSISTGKLLGIHEAR